MMCCEPVVMDIGVDEKMRDATGVTRAQDPLDQDILFSENDDAYTTTVVCIPQYTRLKRSRYVGALHLFADIL